MQPCSAASADDELSQHLERSRRRQPVAFVIVGAFNTLLALALFAAAYTLFGDQIGYMGSLVGAYALSIVVAFQRAVDLDRARE